MWFRLVLALALFTASAEIAAAPIKFIPKAVTPQLLALAIAHSIPATGMSRMRPYILVAGMGPSFDCATVTAPLARLLCTNPRLGLVDLMMVQAYQALRAEVDENTKTEVRSQALDLHQRVHTDCNIPQTGPLTRQVENAADCVDAHYMSQRNEWISRLSSDAREEATRPIRRHIELQRLLQQLSFLSSIANVDGVYGPETRNAISSWQRSRGLNDSGILTDQHAAILEQALAEKAAEEQRQQVAAQELERQRLQREQWEREHADAQQREQRAREEARQHESDAFQAKWDACKAYQLPACDAALQSSNLASWQRTELIRWRSTAQQFAADLQACRNGTIAACDIASKSPAASAGDLAYLAQWRDAASLWTRAWTYISETSTTVMNAVVGAPLSTQIASGIAILLAVALIVLLIFMRKQQRVQAPAFQQELAPEPTPEPESASAPIASHDYSASPPPFTRPHEPSSRPAASQGPRAGGLQAPQAAAHAARQAKYVSGGAKAAGVAINVFFPGIGSFLVKKPIAGVCQVGLHLGAVVMGLSVIVAPILLPFALLGAVVSFGNWIWAIAGAANAPTRPMEVVIQNSPMPGQF